MDDIKRTAITKIDWGNRYLLLLVINTVLCYSIQGNTHGYTCNVPIIYFSQV